MFGMTAVQLLRNFALAVECSDDFFGTRVLWILTFTHGFWLTRIWYGRPHLGGRFRFILQARDHPPYLWSPEFHFMFLTRSARVAEARARAAHCEGGMAAPDSMQGKASRSHLPRPPLAVHLEQACARSALVMERYISPGIP